MTTETLLNPQYITLGDGYELESLQDAWDYATYEMERIREIVQILVEHGADQDQLKDELTIL